MGSMKQQTIEIAAPNVQNSVSEPYWNLLSKHSFSQKLCKAASEMSSLK